MESLEFVWDQGDNEDDSSISSEQFRDVVVFATDWTSETVLRQIEKNNIDLNPAFQRRVAWDTRRQSKFIESLFLGLPVPQLVLAERERGSYYVIDGKQRLSSLQAFALNGSVEGVYADLEPLKLEGLRFLPHLNGMTLDQIRNSEEAHLVSAFENETIHTVVVRNAPDEQYLYVLFDRLNSETYPLSPQELRQALFPGSFTSWVNEFAAESATLHRALRIDGPDRRMRDTEVAVRHLAFRNFRAMYSGNLRKFLDDTCRSLNSAWGPHGSDIRAQADHLELAIDATFEIFGEDAFKKWNSAGRDHGFERRFNRAVFDVMTVFFADESIRTAALERPGEIVGAYQELCEGDAAFMAAISATTKSSQAVTDRFAKWADSLSGVIGFPVELDAEAIEYVDA